MQKLMLIGLGGVIGTLARFGISQWIDGRTSSAFPYGTLFVNLTGCLAAGFLFQLFEQTGWHPNLRLAAIAGFLGAFTTFSAYGLQTLLLAREGALLSGLLNVLLSNAAGLSMVWIGAEIGKRAI